METPIEISEVKGRAQGGYSSAPFRCRGEDGIEYYVKLGNTHPSGRIAEWVGGHLALEIGLPMAEFRLVSVDQELTTSLPAEWKELGWGIGFGSVCAPIGHREIMYSDLPHIDIEMFADLLVFDYWVRNEDRKLGKAQGNPNALWIPKQEPNLLLIDHDNAFDDAFKTRGFFRDHLAREQQSLWLSETRQNAWEEKASVALQALPSIWESIPEEWIIDKYGDALPVPDRINIENLLNQPILNHESFWKPFIQP